MLAAALEVFVERGYPGLTAAAVAERAGVPSSLVQGRWNSMPDLLAAALDEYLDVGTGIDVSSPDTGSLRGDLIELVRMQATVIVKMRAVMAQLASTTRECPEFKHAGRRWLEARRESFLEVFERARARGEIPPETDVDRAVDFVFGPVWARYISGRPLVAGIEYGVVDLLLGGLGVSPAAGGVSRAVVRPRAE